MAGYRIGVMAARPRPAPRNPQDRRLRRPLPLPHRPVGGPLLPRPPRRLEAQVPPHRPRPRRLRGPPPPRSRPPASKSPPPAATSSTSATPFADRNLLRRRSQPRPRPRHPLPRRLHVRPRPGPLPPPRLRQRRPPRHRRTGRTAGPGWLVSGRLRRTCPATETFRLAAGQTGDHEASRGYGRVDCAKAAGHAGKSPRGKGGVPSSIQGTPCSLRGLSAMER